MIAYLNGKYTYKSPTSVYVDVNGVGYHVNVSLHTYSQIETLKEGKLWIHHHITENDQSLFGFHEESEKAIFKHLISVSGIGPSTARMATSYMHPEEIKTAIMQGNVQMVSKIKGIGPKTAKKIILDLQEKLVKSNDETVSPLTNSMDQSVRNEALSALIGLGFQKAKIIGKIDEVIKQQEDNATVESVIKTVLRQLS